MQNSEQARDVSIRYTVTFQDGTVLAHGGGGDRHDYDRGKDQILPILERALQGATRGESREIVLPAENDPGLELDASRLAMLLGHPGETLVLRVEIL